MSGPKKKIYNRTNRKVCIITELLFFQNIRRHLVNNTVYCGIFIFLSTNIFFNKKILIIDNKPYKESSNKRKHKDDRDVLRGQVIFIYWRCNKNEFFTIFKRDAKSEITLKT